MIKQLLPLILLVLVFSCGEDTSSKNPYYSYFFPFEKESKFYVYRDVVHGMNERFLRVFAIEDSKGQHIVVENYAMDGRITEAHNYNIDSLTVLDHMVVDRNGMQTQALLLKNGLFPMNEKQTTWFASKFPGFYDSTMILSETRRRLFQKNPISWSVMGESKNTLVMLDTVRMTQINPFTKRENAQQIVVKSYFSEGIGLVRFHDIQMKTDYRLEKILTKEEFVQMMQR